MSASASERPVGGNRAKAKSISGWTAFDLKQRRKQQGLESDNDSEAYPSLSGLTSPQSLVNKHEPLLEKPFSSVLVASTNFPPLTDIKSRNLQRQVPDSISCLGTVQNTDATKACQELNYLHPWADRSLIQDVLAGVNNNVNEALTLLEAMLICENEDDRNKAVESNWNDSASFDIQGIPFGEKNGMSFSDAPLNVSYKESMYEASSMQLLDAAQSSPVISEPEWEEDDVYLIHRKDAIRLIRSASRYSKAANDAYGRDDHTAARCFSLKAQQERAAAEKFNAKAAQEILNVRNCQNDMWTLDLHGLHAAEAVEALCERLQNVESLESPNCLAAQKAIQKESGMLLAPSPRRQHPASRQRTTLLQVITGKGNHSRGAASLPSAIRSFLNENGYHFDETRPGVIMIRPKFRKQ